MEKIANAVSQKEENNSNKSAKTCRGNNILALSKDYLDKNINQDNVGCF